MKFTVYDQDDNEDLELIGFVEVTIQNLIDKIETQKPHIQRLIDLNDKKKQKTNVGIIKIFPTLLTEKKKAATVTNNILAGLF